MTGSEEESQGPVIRDRRRIDPVTGQPRESASKSGKHAAPKPGGIRRGTPGPGSEDQRAAKPATGGSAGNGAAARDGGAAKDVSEQAAAMLAERTADLQRLQAEYANYRKRVERDRSAVREQALASVLGSLIPVLDDIGRAREHGELTGGFKSVAESLEAVVTKLGLTAYGEAGDPFDPAIHEALMLSYSPDVTEAVCAQILQPGYKVGDRLLRPARVAVAEPADPAGVRPGSGEADGGPDGETASDDRADQAGDDRADQAGTAGASDKDAAAAGTAESPGSEPGPGEAGTGDEPAQGDQSPQAGPAPAGD